MSCRSCALRRGQRTKRRGAGTATNHETATPPAGPGPTITATLADGPLKGRSLEAEVVEGRPPKIIDVPVDHASACRYCLQEWVQTGAGAVYTFLYRV